MADTCPGADVGRVNGYAISPTVSILTSFLALSYVVMLVAPSPYVFATMTNFCYLATGFWRELVTSAERHSASLLVGPLAAGSFVMVFIGASSFAFHRDSKLSSPAHAMDIVFGWMVVTHLFYVTFSVVVIATVKYLFGGRYTPRVLNIVRSVLAMLFLASITVLIALYDDVYRNQTTFFFIVGPAAAVFGGICRAILVYEEGKLHWPAIRLALFEVMVALSAVTAALLSQGELVGLRLSRGTDEEAYDFYHGQWHFLLAMVAGLLYSRTADTARIVQGTHRVCICSLPLLDLSAEVLILLYSALVAIFKETQTNLIVSKSILGGLVVLFLIHCGITFYFSITGSTLDRLFTRTQYNKLSTTIAVEPIASASMPTLP